MIYTVTPNPALDICGVVDRLKPNEKNYVRDVVRSPGGNGVNVARMLTRLGTPCLALGFLGGVAGDEVHQILSRERVRHKFVSIQDSTRSSVTVTQIKTNRQTRLSFPGPTILTSEVRALEHQIRSFQRPFLLMVGGSLPNQYPVSRIRNLLAYATRKDIPVALDCPAPILRQLVESRPILIKPNLAEFQELLGRRVRTLDSVTRAAYDLTRWISMVCVSSVEGGAVLVTHRGAWFGIGQRIRARSTVGAGDSMVGGMLSQLWKWGVVFASQLTANNHTRDGIEQELLQWGIASAMAAVARPTGQLGELSDVRKYVDQVSVTKVALTLQEKSYGFPSRMAKMRFA